MIFIKRLEEPQILKEKKEQWLIKFLEQKKSGKKRPDSKQYGHEQIRNTLRVMSHNKCFYCESKIGIGDVKEEVDHYLEVSTCSEKAFEWENLYLACPECNRKKQPNSSIPVTDCLDPCNPDNKPEEHLTFDKEFIISKNNSELGQKTIQKYNLSRDELNYKRSKELNRFKDMLIKFLKIQNKDRRKGFSQKEKELLNGFRSPEHSFSLMFKSCFDKYLN